MGVANDTSYKQVKSQCKLLGIMNHTKMIKSYTFLEYHFCVDQNIKYSN